MPKGDLQQGRVPTHKDVSVSLEGLLQLPQRVCHHKAECRPQFVSDPAPVAPRDVVSEGRVQTLSFLILCLRLLLFSNQAKQPMAGRLGLGNKAECRFNSRLSPLVLLLVLIQARQPMMAARLQEGNKAECRVLCKKAECQLIGLLLMP